MNTRKKTLEKSMEMLKSNLKAYVSEYGAKNSDTGSSVIESDNLVIENRAVKKVTPSYDKAKKVFEKRSSVMMGITQIHYSIDQEALARLVDEGRITAQEVEDICDMSTSYSFYVIEKKAQPEIEQGSFSTTAQRRKPVLKVGS
jgi:hypothetical protein